MPHLPHPKSRHWPGVFHAPALWLDIYFFRIKNCVWWTCIAALSKPEQCKWTSCLQRPNHVLFSHSGTRSSKLYSWGCDRQRHCKALAHEVNMVCGRTFTRKDDHAFKKFQARTRATITELRSHQKTAVLIPCRVPNKDMAITSRKGFNQGLPGKPPRLSGRPWFDWRNCPSVEIYLPAYRSLVTVPDQNGNNDRQGYSQLLPITVCSLTPCPGFKRKNAQRWMVACLEGRVKQTQTSFTFENVRGYSLTNESSWSSCGTKKRFDLTAKTCGSCREIAPQFLHTFHLEQQLWGLALKDEGNFSKFTKAEWMRRSRRWRQVSVLTVAEMKSNWMTGIGGATGGHLSQLQKK